jgi:predicted enzyme related to lactoylglutathione lyase
MTNQTDHPGVGTFDVVIFDAPDTRKAATFWMGLTGASTSRDMDDGWRSFTTPDGWDLAFQPAPDHVPPQWPGQGLPQQLHLDLRVPDLAAETARAVELGATVLRESEAWNTLADPAGHTFDLCFAENNPGITTMGVMLDCPDAHSLAGFWSAVLGDPVVYDADGMAMLGGSKSLLFQQVENYNPPVWGDPLRPQQLHVEVKVGNMDVAEKATLDLGATRLPSAGAGFRVFADPAGHPFCLVV